MELLKVLFWNTSYCATCRTAQIRRLGRRRPDIVALAEIGRSHVGDYAESLASIGLGHWRDSADQPSALPSEAGSERNLNLLIASRWPLAEISQIGVPWPERALSVFVRSPWRPIEVHAVHMPTGVGWASRRSKPSRRSTTRSVAGHVGRGSSAATSTLRRRSLPTAASNRTLDSEGPAKAGPSSFRVMAVAPANCAEPR